jgi:hypothetical protein
MSAVYVTVLGGSPVARSSANAASACNKTHQTDPYYPMRNFNRVLNTH